jgi:hypothetical protein
MNPASQYLYEGPAELSSGDIAYSGTYQLVNKVSGTASVYFVYVENLEVIPTGNYYDAPRISRLTFLVMPSGYLMSEGKAFYPSEY